MTTDDLTTQIKELRFDVNALKRQHEFEAAIKRTDDQELSSLRTLVLQLRDLVLESTATGAEESQAIDQRSVDGFMDQMIFQRLVMQGSTLQLMEANQQRILSALDRLVL